jgi:hypothetical protein
MALKSIRLVFEEDRPRPPRLTIATAYASTKLKSLTTIKALGALDQWVLIGALLGRSAACKVVIWSRCAPCTAQMR